MLITSPHTDDSLRCSQPIAIKRSAILLSERKTARRTCGDALVPPLALGKTAAVSPARYLAELVPVIETG
jgi:hypothetical protein